MEPDVPPPEHPATEEPAKAELGKPGPQHVEFALDRIAETARVGFARAAVFTGLGCNAALRPDVIEYHLDHATRFRVLPETVPAEMMKEWKGELYNWTVASGLRDIVDFTNRFLEQLYEALSIATLHRRDAKALKRFDKGGLKDKIASLEAEFGIHCRYPDTLVSIGAVRNCLVHRLGIVGPQDLDASGQLTLSWFGFVLQIKGEGGLEIPGPSLAGPSGGPEMPIPVSPGDEIQARFQVFSEQFALGKKVVITPHVLHQVLWSVQQMTNEYVTEVTKWARAKGILRE